MPWYHVKYQKEGMPAAPKQGIKDKEKHRLAMEYLLIRYWDFVDSSDNPYPKLRRPKLIFVGSSVGKIGYFQTLL